MTGQEPRGIRVVTVSATYGAFGSVIAPQLAKRLDLPFADRLIPAIDVPHLGPGTEHVTEEERRQVSRSRFLTRLAHITGGLGLPVPTPEEIGDPVRERVEQSIDQLLRTGGAVILGRAGAVVLAGHPRAFHVRLDGPEERRIAAVMVSQTTDEDTCRTQLRETDQTRTRYVERLYGRNPADPLLYHLLLDSTVLALDDSVEVIAAAASAFWEHASLPH